MSIEIDLSGRTVLVTGGTRGIGAGIATQFLRAGADVHVCSRSSPDALPEFDGRLASFSSADVRDPEQVDALINAVTERSGRLDVVVNNAGGAPFADTASASIRFHSKVVELNLIAPLLISQRALPVMTGQDGGGSVINISSVSGRRGSPGTASYGAAKAGLDNLTSTLAMEFAPKVRVNSVTVGVAQTEDHERNFGDSETMDEIGTTIPMGRAAEPDDVGQACLFLASPLASYITGSTVTVDGGGEMPPYLAKLKES